MIHSPEDERFLDLWRHITNGVNSDLVMRFQHLTDNDGTAHSVLLAGFHSFSNEQTIMIQMVLMLAEQKQNYFDEVIRLRNLLPPEPIVLKGV